jgi:hypothetical protein
MLDVLPGLILSTPLSLSKQTNNFQSLLSLLLSNLMKKRSLREKRNTIWSRRRRRRQCLETKPPKTTTGNLDSGSTGRRSVIAAAVESCWQRQKKDNDKEQWRGSWGALGRWRSKSKEQKQQRYSATTQKAEEEKEKSKAKAKGLVKKNLFSSLEFTPPTLLSSHPRANFLPHSKKTNKKCKKKTQHNPEKTDFSKRKRVFSLDRLTQYQNIK